LANPQAEDGHIDIAHEIAEAFARIRLSGEEVQCLWVIFRKTYGWKKLEDRISLSQFSEATGLKRQHVHRALKKLEERGVISVTKNGDSLESVTKKGYSQMNSYRFIKDFEKWVLSPKKVTVTNIGSRLYPKMVHTKENYTKENYIKTLVQSTVTKNGDSETKPKPSTAKTFDESSDTYRLAALLLQKILERKPNFKKPNLQAWAGSVDRILRGDGRSVQAVENVIVWCQKDDFWQNNILSTGKLREKFDQLELKMEKETGVAPYRKPNGGSPGAPIPESKSLRKFREAEEQVQREQAEKEKAKDDNPF